MKTVQLLRLALNRTLVLLNCIIYCNRWVQIWKRKDTKVCEFIDAESHLRAHCGLGQMCPTFLGLGSGISSEPSTIDSDSQRGRLLNQTKPPWATFTSLIAPELGCFRVGWVLVWLNKFSFCWWSSFDFSLLLLNESSFKTVKSRNKSGKCNVWLDCEVS